MFSKDSTQVKFPDNQKVLSVTRFQEFNSALVWEDAQPEDQQYIIENNMRLTVLAGVNKL